MAAALCFSTLSVFAVLGVVDGAYTCSSGWTAKAGTPKCNGIEDSTCTSSTCCDEVPTCSDFSAEYVGLQLIGKGCATDKKFFDLKQLDAEVSSPQAAPDVKAACCSAPANAHCSDWLNSCPSGHSVVSTNAAPADGEDGTSLTNDKFVELCCVVTPSTCGDSAVAYGVLQLIGQGCATDTKFFDMKKLSVEVASPQADDDIKATCCTPFADALCSDWPARTCAAGHAFVGTSAAPADSSEGKLLSDAKFQEHCCAPKKCDAFSAAWLLAQAVGGGCAEDGKFFDLGKTNTEVASPAVEDDIKTACCTAYADASCNDWLVTCGTGTFLKEGAAPPDSANGKVLSQSKFRELCCVEALKCSDYGTADDASGSLLRTQASAAALAGYAAAVLFL